MKKNNPMILLLVTIFVFPSLLFAGTGDDPLKGLSDLGAGAMGAVSSAFNAGASTIGSLHNDFVAAPLKSNTIIRDVYKQVGNINPLGLGSGLQSVMKGTYDAAVNPVTTFNSGVSGIATWAGVKPGTQKLYSDLNAPVVTTTPATTTNTLTNWSKETYWGKQGAGTIDKTLGQISGN